MTRLPFIAALLVTFVADAAAQQADVRFIACPILRDVDAGRKSGCWLADDPATGVRYDVGSAPTKPDWNHEILVEGHISQKPDSCGGVVLEPVRVSVLPGACTRHALPAEDFKGRPFVLPDRVVRPMSVSRPAPQPPFTEQTFSLLFDWNRDFLVYQLDDYYIDQAITYIRGVKPKRIVITGYGATTPAIVSGRSLAEDTHIAKRRAEKIADALTRLGVDPTTIETKWKNAADASPAPGADGVAEASRRRVDIRVIP